MAIEGDLKIVCLERLIVVKMSIAPFFFGRQKLYKCPQVIGRIIPNTSEIIAMFIHFN